MIGKANICTMTCNEGTEVEWRFSSTLSLISALDWMGGSRHASPWNDPVRSVKEADWAQGWVWTIVENSAPTGIRSPDRPASSESLCRLRYLAHCELKYRL